MAEPSESKSPLTVDVTSTGDFNVGPRFIDLQPVGYGATGLVFSATDSECDKNVAIKKLHFSDRAMCIQALREVRIMRRMEHENVLTVYEVLDSKGLPLGRTPALDHLHSMYIVQELMDTDLRQLIHSGQLMAEHVKLLSYQLLRGLKYIHSANVLHRDLKPNNLLINGEDLVLKIADFGVARIVDPHYDHKGFLTESVGNCWYRAPELVLHPRDYSKAIDMWSCGCVLAEMLLGRPLLPAAHELDLLRLLIDLIHLDDSGWDQVLAVMPNKMLKNHPLRARTPLARVLSGVDPLALDLIEKLLVFEPSQRLSAEEAVAHPYFSQYSCPWDEPVAAQPFFIESEVDNLSPSQVKKLILDETVGPHPTCGSQVPVECFCGMGTVSSPRSSSPEQAEEEDEETHTLEEIMNIRADCEEAVPPGGTGVDSLNRRNLRNTQIADIQEDLNILRIVDSDQDEEEETDHLEHLEHLEHLSLDHEAAAAHVPKYLSIEEKDIDEKDPYQEDVDEDDEIPLEGIEDTVPVPIAEFQSSLLNPVMRPGEAAVAAGHVPSVLQQDELNIHSPESDDNTETDAVCLCQQWAGQWCNLCSCPPVDAARLQVALQDCHKMQETNRRIISTIPEVEPAEDADDENMKEKLVAEKSPSRKYHRRHKGAAVKSRKKKTRQHVLSSSEFDEMYRLPTEHLGRDFSNERLKSRPTGKAHNNRINEEINERLKEERQQHGACGGMDLQTNNSADSNLDLQADQCQYFRFDRSSTVLFNRHLEYDLRNNQISSSTIELSAHNWSDSSHSPEQPSSPRASNRGARPKRSPRKQKHKAV